MYCDPSFTCVPVFISGKFGLKPNSAKILGLKFEEAKSITRPDRAAKKKTLYKIFSIANIFPINVPGIIVWHGLWCVGL